MTAAPSSPLNIVRGVIVFVLAALLLLLFFLTVRSLLFSPNQTLGDQDPQAGTATAETSPPAGPVVAEPLDADTSTAGGVSCGRPELAAGAGAFRVSLAETMDPNEEVVVAVDLIGAGGERHGRIATVPAGGDPPRQVLVPDSTEAGTYRSCVITAIQVGKRVVYTGR